MVVTTTVSTEKRSRLYEGTAQEVLDAMDGDRIVRFLAFGFNQTTGDYWALMRDDLV